MPSSDQLVTIGPSNPRAAAGAPTSDRRVRLPVPFTGRTQAEQYVQAHLAHMLERRARDWAGQSMSSPAFRGGQVAADAALERFSVVGYAAGFDRPAVYPQARRRSSALSPWVRHGLLSLPRLWDHVAGGPALDVEAFRRSLLRQEHARHRYAGQGMRATSGADRWPEPYRPQPQSQLRTTEAGDATWDRRLGCIELTLDELEEDGWLPDEARRWLASHWALRNGRHWHYGDDYLFRHLLDGSRAAGRLGWRQVLAGRDGPYRFTRWQVEAQAPGLCATCELVHACPIERWPELGARRIRSEVAGAQPPGTGDHGQGAGRPGQGEGGDGIAGPVSALDGGRAEAVWLTAESMGDDDPALAAHPELPAVFVFDEPLLLRLRLSAKRLVFLVETLADLATRHPIEVWLGPPVAVLAGRPLAATFTPVPGWRRRSSRLDIAATHPWPWLRRPLGADVGSFAGWKAAVG